MQNNTIIINNKEYRIPEIVVNLFNEHLQDYYKKQKYTDLSNMKNNLEEQIKNISDFQFIKKNKIKKQIEELSLKLNELNTSKENIEIPNWETIDDYSLKYQFLFKLVDLVTDCVSMEIKENNEDSIIPKIHQAFNGLRNSNINHSKLHFENKNYNKAFSKLYNTLEIDLSLKALDEDYDNNPNLDINKYINGIIPEVFKEEIEEDISNIIDTSNNKTL